MPFLDIGEEDQLHVRSFVTRLSKFLKWGYAHGRWMDHLCNVYSWVFTSKSFQKLSWHVKTSILFSVVFHRLWSFIHSDSLFVLPSSLPFICSCLSPAIMKYLVKSNLVPGTIQELTKSWISMSLETAASLLCTELNCFVILNGDNRTLLFV